MRLIITIAFMACSYMASAQKATPTPATPATPATPTKVSSNTTSVVTINGKTYVSTSSSDTGKAEAKSSVKANSSSRNSSSSSSTTSSSTSVSIHNSDFTYSIRASFDDNKTEKIRKILMDNLEKDYFSSKSDTYTWKKLEDGETAYNFTLSEGKLKGSVNKELNSNNAIDKFVTLGEKISEALSNN